MSEIINNGLFRIGINKNNNKLLFIFDNNNSLIVSKAEVLKYLNKIENKIFERLEENSILLTIKGEIENDIYEYEIILNNDIINTHYKLVYKYYSILI